MPYDFYKGADVTAVASGTADVQALAATAELRLLGFSCRECAGTPAAAEFVIREGTDNTGTALAFITLVAGESVREFFGEQGLNCAGGLYIDRISGTTEISLYTKAA